MGLPFFYDPQFCQDSKLPLLGLQGEAGLVHDLPLVIRFPRMGAKKIQNPRPRGGTKEFHQLLVFISHVYLVWFVWLIGSLSVVGLDWSVWFILRACLLHPCCASAIFPIFQKPGMALTEKFSQRVPCFHILPPTSYLIGDRGYFFCLRLPVRISKPQLRRTITLEAKPGSISKRSSSSRRHGDRYDRRPVPDPLFTLLHPLL